MVSEDDRPQVMICEECEALCAMLLEKMKPGSWYALLEISRLAGWKEEATADSRHHLTLSGAVAVEARGEGLFYRRLETPVAAPWHCERPSQGFVCVLPGDHDGAYSPVYTREQALRQECEMCAANLLTSCVEYQERREERRQAQEKLAAAEKALQGGQEELAREKASGEMLADLLGTTEQALVQARRQLSRWRESEWSEETREAVGRAAYHIHALHSSLPSAWGDLSDKQKNLWVNVGHHAVDQHTLCVALPEDP